MKTNKKSLAVILGSVSAAAALMVITPKFEGTVQKTYKDIGGVLTYCTGATEDAQWGKTYTLEECKAQLDYDLARHAEGIQRCLRWSTLTEGQKIAYVDTAYNIGVGNFCGSTITKKANQGDVTGSCQALESWACITVAEGKGDISGQCASKKVDKKFVQGLLNRRKEARQYCEGLK